MKGYICDVKNCGLEAVVRWWSSDGKTKQFICLDHSVSLRKVYDYILIFDPEIPYDIPCYRTIKNGNENNIYK
jgi:hypothetical protein